MEVNINLPQQHASRRQTTQPTIVLSNPREISLRESCPTKEAFVANFKFVKAAANFTNDLRDAYMGQWPTLKRISQICGRGAGQLWIRAMFMQIFVASGAQDPAMVKSVEMAADAFCADVYSVWPISTLVVFFQRFMAGRYTSATDMRVNKHDAVGAAFYKQFLPERLNEIEAFVEADKKAEEERNKTVIPDGYTSREWFNENVRRALNGDMEAVQNLTAPNSTIEETLQWLETKRNVQGDDYAPAEIQQQ